MMSGASSVDELHASSQETVAVDGNICGASDSTVVLKSKTGTVGCEVAGRLGVSNLEITVVELGVAIKSYSTPNLKRSTSRVSPQARAGRNVGHGQSAEKRTFIVVLPRKPPNGEAHSDAIDLKMRSNSNPKGQSIQGLVP